MLSFQDKAKLIGMKVIHNEKETSLFDGLSFCTFGDLVCHARSIRVCRECDPGLGSEQRSRSGRL